MRRERSVNASRRRIVRLVVGAAALSAIPRLAAAQSYPSRPIRCIVPLAAGGGLDFTARLVAEHLSRALGQQVVVENRPGMGGMLGIEAAARSAPDGHTILVSTDVLASGPHVTSVNTDYVNELAPIGLLTVNPQVMAANAALGVSSVRELITLARERPGLAYATSGTGTQQHFVGAWLAQLAGIRLEHVPYRGAGQAINDLIAGHVQLAVLGPVALVPHARAGTLRLLAQSTERRSPSLPDVPTFEEAGVLGLVLETWQGAFAPARTPPAIIARLNAELRPILADPVVRERFLQSGQNAAGSTVEELTALVRKDSDKYRRLARELKIRGE